MATDEPLTEAGGAGSPATLCSPHWTVDGRLFQARMWRRYAMDWDLPDWHIRRRWVEHTLGISRDDCLRRARINVRLAKRINKQRKMDRLRQRLRSLADTIGDRIDRLDRAYNVSRKTLELEFTV